MQPKQKEIHDVNVKIRETIVIGVMHLLNCPGQALVVRFKREGQDHFTPAFRIKYMNTAGGMQIGLHDVIVNGLGSGQYLPAGETVEILKAAIAKIRNVVERQDSFADRFDRDDQRVVDLEVILVNENIHPVGHTNNNDYEDLFPDAIGITLTLPENIETL